MVYPTFVCVSGVVMSDRGVYTCNLHHHYCQMQQSIQVQLNVTKSGNSAVDGV